MATRSVQSFQEVIMALHRFWAEQGCILWQPYNVQIAAGTNNPATLLKVLGPEPWRVAYVEPSVRPDDGRYAENPNRMQLYYQYQVILKPDPGNPQELYLKSLQAVGIDLKQHDVRFVEDNWETPAFGAWGLGWEVWLDGQEISQFTYFQQAGGITLDVPSVEITYGLERIVLALQGKNSAWEIDWTDGVKYADVFKRSEWEHSSYYFEVADVEALRKVYDTYEHESRHALVADLIVPAYDYLLKCSHLFNVLDTRGAIGVTERASYFKRMRDMARQIAKAYVDQRQTMEFPLLNNGKSWPVVKPATSPVPSIQAPQPDAPATVLLEIGVEELPAGDLDDALAQLNQSVPALFDSLRLTHTGITIVGTPRRLTMIVDNVAARQPDRVDTMRGPSANIAFDKEGKPTKAAEGFAKKQGVPVESLEKREIEGGQYVVATVKTAGQSAPTVLAKALPELIGGLKFGKSMRWNETGVAFSRPVRWIVALFGADVIRFTFAGVPSGNTTHGTRPAESPEIPVSGALDYTQTVTAAGIVLSKAERRAKILKDAEKLATEVGGSIRPDEGLLDEVANLVEQPTALRGTFDKKFLDLPLDVLVTVMRKHQRYLAVVGPDSKLLPYFVAVRNGDSEHLDTVIKGNEHVLVARFTDADFFFRDDRQRKLADFLPRLSTLIVHDRLGSMYDKNARLSLLVKPFAELLHLSDADRLVAEEAAPIAKADLATRMVVEMTSLAGVMGREYALREDRSPAVATTIFETVLPRGAGDQLPVSMPGVLLALADRLDSLLGFFAIGVVPTANTDPYGLRRAALGVVQILIERQIDFDLRVALDQVAAVLPVAAGGAARADALGFIAGRLRAWLLDEAKLPFDVVEATLAEQSHNPYRALIGCRELATWVARADWPQTLDAYARCVRITRAEPEFYPLDPARLSPSEALDLYLAAGKAAAELNPTDNVNAFLQAFQDVIPAITAFFDHVLVMDEDLMVRENRLALLQYVTTLAKGRADLSKLSGF
ncbi:MAG: glycine--tRNA ligase subunit beta [Aggregatilineales bacterium]